MAQGVVSVPSLVGVNKEIIKNGVNGYNTNDIDVWRKLFSLLIKDIFILGYIGCVARTLIENEFSIASTFPLFLDTLISELQLWGN